MKIYIAPEQSFSEHAPSFNYRTSMDTKGPINPPSHNKSYIQVIIDAFSHFVVTVPIKSKNAKTEIKTFLHHSIELLNLVHLYTLSLIADPNMVTRKWHTSVHLWELDTPLEQLILLGQMALSKYKTEMLALIYECFHMTLQKIGHSRSICLLMHKNPNLFQNSMFLLTKLFSTQDLEYQSLLI